MIVKWWEDCNHPVYIYIIAHSTYIIAQSTQLLIRKIVMNAKSFHIIYVYKKRQEDCDHPVCMTNI